VNTNDVTVSALRLGAKQKVRELDAAAGTTYRCYDLVRHVLVLELLQEQPQKREGKRVCKAHKAWL